MKIAAIYARVSSDQQKDDNTIASQTAALIDFAQSHSYSVSEDLVFEDDGYSGASLVRPGLERVRDLVYRHSRMIHLRPMQRIDMTTTTFYRHVPSE